MSRGSDSIRAASSSFRSTAPGMAAMARSSGVRTSRSSIVSIASIAALSSRTDIDWIRGALGLSTLKAWPFGVSDTSIVIPSAREAEIGSRSKRTPEVIASTSAGLRGAIER